MPHMKAGEAVISALYAEGVDHIFGVVGTTTNTMITELYGRRDIRFIDSRHEEGAAFMAYGYAKASGSRRHASPHPAPALPTSSLALRWHKKAVRRWW